MKINPLNSIYNFKMQTFPKRGNLNVPYSDVFIRTLPSFSSSGEKDLSFESFNNWAIKSHYLDAIDADHDKAKGLMLGAGFEGEVFEIPGTDDWVIKEHKRSSIIPIKTQKATLVKIDDIIPDMNVGQTIGCLRFPCGPNYSYSYYIRKKQKGITLGVDPKDMDKIHSYNINGHLASLKLLSEAPQSTYNQLIIDLNRIYNEGYEVDCSNLNNFLYDLENDTINFVDVNDKHKHQGNQLADTLYSLLDTELYCIFDENNPEEIAVKLTSVEYAKSIAEKFFAAMKSQNMKFVPGKYLERLISTDLLNSVLGAETTEEKIDSLKSENLLD